MLETHNLHTKQHVEREIIFRHVHRHTKIMSMSEAHAQKFRGSRPRLGLA